MTLSSNVSDQSPIIKVLYAIVRLNSASILPLALSQYTVYPGSSNFSIDINTTIFPAGSYSVEVTTTDMAGNISSTIGGDGTQIPGTKEYFTIEN
jgi:hypothetical protein